MQIQPPPPAPKRTSLRPRTLLLTALSVLAMAALPACGARDRGAPRQANSFILAGSLQQQGQGQWLVQGVPVAVDEQTSVQGAPQIGAALRVRGEIRGDGVLLAREITAAAGAPGAGAETPAPPAPTDAPQPTAPPAPTDAPQPTAPPAPTDAPQPTAPPAPTDAPQPTAPPAPADAPPSPTTIAAVRTLLEAGIADGRLQQKAGRDLLKKLNELERELDGGKQDKIADKLRDVATRTIQLTRDGAMDAGLAEEVLRGLAAVAESAGMRLTTVPADGADGADGGDDDEDD